MGIRRIIGVFLVLVLLCSAFAFTAEAATRVDVTAVGSLKLTYGYDGQPFVGEDIRIYQVAEISAFAEYSLTGAFSHLPVEVNGIRAQVEWDALASTLSAFIVSEKIAPTMQMPTAEDGIVTFTHLPLGLYLVSGVRVDKENGFCYADSFMISVPDLNEEDAWVYDVVAKPKSAFQEVLPKEITYTVNKLWKDEGYQHLRPQSVSIELYKNQEKVETVVLSKENNWSYSWVAVDDGSVWTAVEINVPEGYSVTLSRRGNHFSATNFYGEPTPPPKTGDSTNIHFYLLLMCGAGAGLIVLGVIGKRGKIV